MIYREKISKIFKDIPVTIPEPNTDNYSKKIQALFLYIRKMVH